MNIELICLRAFSVPDFILKADPNIKPLKKDDIYHATHHFKGENDKWYYILAEYPQTIDEDGRIFEHCFECKLFAEISTLGADIKAALSAPEPKPAFKKGQKVVCAEDFIDLPGARNFTKPVRGETYTVKAYGSAYNPEAGMYIEYVELEEISNVNADFTDCEYKNMHPGQEFPFGAQFFKPA